MSEAQREPDLRPLETKYQILSELRTGSAVRTYMARSRDDGIDVVITVAQGGENNALAHFASDNQLLSTVSHPAVPRVLDRHWLGEDFAVVRERIRGRSLHELLSADERLTNVQIAAVLQTVHGIMDWARQLGVVHRGVTPKTVFFEEHSERVLVALVPTRMPIEGIPDASADAATIGELAWAMLTGSPREADAEHASERLGELRPDLPTPVRDEVVRMTQHKNGGDAPDIAAFIATIAMADALKQGEIEAARLQAEMVEEVRAEREERERALRAREQKNIEDREALADERDRLTAETAAAREKAEAEREQIAGERERITADRAEIANQRAELEKREARLKEELKGCEARLQAQFKELDARRKEVERQNAEEAKRLKATLQQESAALQARRAEIERLNAEEAQRLEVTLQEQLATLDARRAELERLNAEEAKRLEAARREIEQLRAEQERRNIAEAEELPDNAATILIPEERRVADRRTNEAVAIPIWPGP